MTQVDCPISPPFSNAAEAAEASRSTREASARRIEGAVTPTMPSPAALRHAAVGSHLGMRCRFLCIAGVEWKLRRKKSERADGAADGGESGESGADMQGTLVLANPVSSSRVSPRQGKEFGRFVSNPGLTGSPIRVHRPVSRHAVNVTTGPLRTTWQKMASVTPSSQCSVRYSTMYTYDVLRGLYFPQLAHGPESRADLDCIAPSPPQPSCRVLSVFHTKFLTTRVRGGCLLGLSGGELETNKKEGCPLTSPPPSSPLHPTHADLHMHIVRPYLEGV